MRRLAVRISAALLATAAAGPALAGSAAQPGQTIGLPTGAQLPVGLYFVNLSSFGVRDTAPQSSESNVNLPTLALSTPWNVLGARLHLFFTQPVAASSVRGAPYQSGIGQQLLAGQLAWDLGGDVGVSYLFGGYLPIDTRFLTQEASLSHRFAVSYTGQGYNLTANLLYGTFLSERSPNGVLYPDYLNLDLAATKKFGKWEIGPVAFGSIDLPVNVPGYRRPGPVRGGRPRRLQFRPGQPPGLPHPRRGRAQLRRPRDPWLAARHRAALPGQGRGRARPSPGDPPAGRVSPGRRQRSA